MNRTGLWITCFAVISIHGLTAAADMDCGKGPAALDILNIKHGT